MGDRVQLEIDDGIARIALDDGKVNAMSGERMAEIGTALDAAERAGAVVVLAGRAGIFSAGFDLPTFQRGLEATVTMLHTGAGLIERLVSFPHPVLAVCAGHAYPMGAFLLLASDVRIGAAGAWRIGMNEETAIGLTVPRFALELARHRLSPSGFAGVASGAMHGPDEAMQLGYLDRVVPAEALAGAAREEALRLRTLDRPSFAATKARIHEEFLARFRAAVREELTLEAVPAAG